MANRDLFNPGTEEQHAFMLAKHLPSGRFWASAFDSIKDIGKLIQGLAISFHRLSVLIKQIETEMDINQTTDLVTEWEKSVSIPNDCFSINETIERRRLQIRELFSNYGGVQKAEDLVRVAAVFGIEITITPGKALHAFPLVFPILFIGDDQETGHTIVIEFVGESVIADTFPLTFPVVFGNTEQEFLICLFETIIPANVQLMFI